MASFERGNSSLYIDAVYDGHFDLSLLGKSLDKRLHTARGARRVRGEPSPTRSRRARRRLLDPRGAARTAPRARGRGRVARRAAPESAGQLGGLLPHGGPPARGDNTIAVLGRVAQWESARFTREAATARERPDCQRPPGSLTCGPAKGYAWIGRDMTEFGQRNRAAAHSRWAPSTRVASLAMTPADHLAPVLSSRSTPAPAMACGIVWPV